MPIRRTAIARRFTVTPKLTFSRKWELFTGKPAFADDEPLSDDQLRELWELHRETVMREYSDKFPGKRCYAQRRFGQVI